MGKAAAEPGLRRVPAGTGGVSLDSFGGDQRGMRESKNK